MSNTPPTLSRWAWLTPAVLGIVLATFLSDFGHEAATAVLPLYLSGLSLTAASLGLIEGVADLCASLAKLGGGFAGHHVRRKRGLAALGYMLTALATAAIGLVGSLGGILTCRCLAWSARGFRGPLRDALLAENVPATHYGRAYGLERAGDMLGAVAGPLAAALFLWLGYQASPILLWSVVPGVLAGAAIWFLVKERGDVPVARGSTPTTRPPFPRMYWMFLIGVFLFGLGDFSRSFLILLVGNALGMKPGTAVGSYLTLAVLLYAAHNLLSAVAAYTIGMWSDRTSRVKLLILGYGLGVLCNGLLAWAYLSLAGVIAAVILSAVYIAAEETLEKATVAQLLPTELRSLGFGILGTVNAVGDMVSSVVVGLLLDADQGDVAFGLAAAVGAAGVFWLVWLTRRPAMAA